MKPSEFCTVVTSTDSFENAELITQTLLEKRLAACIQSSTIKSAYRWQGKVITSEEIRLEIKTMVSLYDDVRVQIKSLHTYDVPEILMFRVENASFSYLKWLEEEITSSAAAPVSTSKIPEN